MTSLSELNGSDQGGFVTHLGGIFEHSPWVAERAWERRPFATLEALHAAMVAVVNEASEEQQTRLLRAHPELAGREAQQGKMTEHSTQEQGSSGLLHCSMEELARLRELNSAYGEKFGFPFIIAVRGLDRTAIIAEFTRRLANERRAEMSESLRQIARITGFRLAAALAPAESRD